ncbi:hypothetical protein JMUB4039_2363 [Leptotrichia trevisanii]|jgi:hypothetical protein|uniref:hypothetical protein n=1 Tax=Leptotrichia trevisanii TaxID=109328 RepID=UPI001187FC3F|nr:hypothetical protein [Leptotrichia trevisanii]BBM58353.1 hypothetical protein JMUB4039_2363 [Leptotrichia trevisanii]
MRKMLFLIMLVIAGNSFTAPTSRSSKNTGMVSQVSESEKREFERAIKNDVEQPINDSIKAELSKSEELKKIAYESLFNEDYNISESLKKEMAQKFLKTLIDLSLKGLDLKIVMKKVNRVSENEVEILYDTKAKNTENILSISGKEEILGERVLKRMGYSMNKMESILKNKGNDEIKRKFYNITMEEMAKIINQNIHELKDEQVLVEDIPATLKKVNGKWQVQDTDN